MGSKRVDVCAWARPRFRKVLARSLGRGLQVAVEARDHYAAECRRLESHLGEAQADLRAKDALHEKVHGVLQQELGALRQRSAGLEEEVARLKAQRALGGAPMQEVAQAGRGAWRSPWNRRMLWARWCAMASPEHVGLGSPEPMRSQQSMVSPLPLCRST